MNVKGSALVSTLEFVEIKYGKDAIQKVLEKLPEEDRKILSEPIMQPIWYPFKLYIDLTEKIDFIF